MDDLELKISPFQERVLSIPEQYDLALGGGRGGSKSVTLALIALRHSEQYKTEARTLYLRQTYKGLEDFASITQEMYGMIYGKAARFNQAEHVWKFPNRAYLELGQLENPSDYRKYMGRSFTLLLIDELGQYAVPDLPDKVRSNLRGASDIPIRQCAAMNPGDAGHYWGYKRYILNHKPWKPFLEKDSNKKCVYAPSTFLDNPFIDQAEYKRQLEASCPSDPELLRAWLEGDWEIARGAYFGSVLDQKRNMTEPWPHLPLKELYDIDEWEFYLSHDYGSSAPSVTYIIAKSPGAIGPDKKWYSRDSLILVDELATNMPGHLNKGLGWTIPILSEAIIELAEKWKMQRPEGVADDAIFAQHGSGAGSIADEFSQNGVFFQPAKKADRKTGWEIMKRMLQDAGKVDKPGLYISRNCEYFWETVPFLGRDPKRADDVNSNGPDHSADSARYACLFQKYELEVVSINGI